MSAEGMPSTKENPSRYRLTSGDRGPRCGPPDQTSNCRRMVWYRSVDGDGLPCFGRRRLLRGLGCPGAMQFRERGLQHEDTNEPSLETLAGQLGRPIGAGRKIGSAVVGNRMGCGEVEIVAGLDPEAHRERLGIARDQFDFFNRERLPQIDPCPTEGISFAQPRIKIGRSFPPSARGKPLGGDPNALPILRSQQPHSPSRGSAPCRELVVRIPNAHLPKALDSRTQGFPRVRHAHGLIGRDATAVPQIALVVGQFLRRGGNEDLTGRLLLPPLVGFELPGKLRLCASMPCGFSNPSHRRFSTLVSAPMAHCQPQTAIATIR